MTVGSVDDVMDFLQVFDQEVNREREDRHHRAHQKQIKPFVCQREGDPFRQCFQAHLKTRLF